MKAIRAVMMILFFAVAFSWMQGERAWAGPEKYEKLAASLKFTPEQREKLQKIQDEYHKTLPGKHQAMDQARMELETALKSEMSNDEVRKKFAEVEKRQTEFTEARFEKVLAVRALLTAEQRKMFNVYDEKPNPDVEKKCP
jgi:Spy/CpxP family protein refolding chaperone